ncbi:hypothetical protein AGJ33_21095 [Cronobacter dublinensis subsp. dublinensis]|nr:hypothetical protein [Cronobacter dublinensis subsp. dublinensis]
MFAKKSELYSGSEYHDCLMSFIRKEAKRGSICLKKSRFFYIIRYTVLSLCVIFAILFAMYISGFYQCGDIEYLIKVGVSGFLTLVFIAIFSVFPAGQQSWFEYIDGEFDHDAMFRLYTHGAPDDVIDKVIISLGRTETLTYSQLYDIFWVCCRSSDGSDIENFLADRYRNVKSKIRAHYLRKGKAI